MRVLIFVPQEKVSGAVSKYVNNGFMDILQNKWFSDLPCVNRELETSDLGQPTPLGVDAFLGVFLMLGCGIVVGLAILCLEHAFYHYALPKLRQTPPDSIWRNQNIMFVSQVRRCYLQARRNKLHNSLTLLTACIRCAVNIT